MKPHLLTRRSSCVTDKSPLLFVHGAYAGAWYWDVNFLPFFQTRGYDSYAVSFRGHGESPGRQWLWSFGLNDFVEDLTHALSLLPSPPIVIAHSMGGYVTLQLVRARRPELAGLVLISPASPEGHWADVVRMLTRYPVLSSKCNWMNVLPKAAWEFLMTPEEFRRMMMSDATSLDSVQRIMPGMQHESIRAMTQMLWPVDGPPLDLEYPLLLIGGESDVVIPPESLQRIGALLHTEPVILPGMGHSMMIEDGWRDPAGHILSWLDEHTYVESA